MRMLIFAVSCTVMLCDAALPTASVAAAATVRRDFQLLPRPGEKVPLDAGHYFTYGFVKQPKLGSAIMRVEMLPRS